MLSSSYDDVDGIPVAFINVGVRAIFGAWIVGVSYAWQNKRMSNSLASGDRDCE
jgi:hypothetical protein